MKPNQNMPDFQFDPSDYQVFQEKLRAAVENDPFTGLALKEIIISDNVIFDLPSILNRAFNGRNSILLVMDKTPMRRGKDDLKPLVAKIIKDGGFNIKTLDLEGDEYGVVHPDFEQVEIVRNQIDLKTIVVGLGSGVIVDICKYACYLFDQNQAEQAPIPLISIPTANSVPAFASALSIISKDGVKRTWPSRLPDIILYDLNVLHDSPQELIMGGVGDMCGMFVSSLEWFFGIYLGVVADSPAAQLILNDARKFLVSNSEAIGKRTKEGMAMLANLLTLGGLSMTFAKDSTPMSGYEHGFAHLLDMGAHHFQRPIRNHGSQVAVSVIYVLIALERFLNEFDPDKVIVDNCYPDAEGMQKRITSVFAEIDPSGFMGQECWRDYQKKLNLWKENRPGFERLLTHWNELLPRMREMILTPEVYTRLLKNAGHPLEFEDLGVKESEARWAYRNAYMLRKRLSTTDLMIFMDWIDENWIDWVFNEKDKLVEKVKAEV